MAIEQRDDRRFDVRLRRRLLDANIITQDEVKKFLSKLPDAADNMEVSEVRFEKKSGFAPDI